MVYVVSHSSSCNQGAIFTIFFSPLGKSWPWNSRSNQKEPCCGHFYMLWRSASKNIHLDGEGLLSQISEICLLQRPDWTNKWPQNRQTCTHLSRSLVIIWNCVGEQRHRMKNWRGWSPSGGCQEHFSCRALVGIFFLAWMPGTANASMHPEALQKCRPSLEKRLKVEKKWESLWKRLEKLMKRELWSPNRKRNATGKGMRNTPKMFTIHLCIHLSEPVIVSI